MEEHQVYPVFTALLGLIIKCLLDLGFEYLVQDALLLGGLRVQYGLALRDFRQLKA